jgi:hypothetical protein
MMDEREIAKTYRALSKRTEFKSQVEKIENLRHTVTPKKNMELKTLLVGASEHEGMLRAKSLQFLDKKISQAETRVSKESKENDEKMSRLMANEKIKYSRSIRQRKLKKNFRKTRKVIRPALSPIAEGSKEHDSKSKSPWRTVHSEPKSKNVWLFGLF